MCIRDSEREVEAWGPTTERKLGSQGRPNYACINRAGGKANRALTHKRANAQACPPVEDAAIREEAFDKVDVIPPFRSIRDPYVHGRGYVRRLEALLQVSR